MAQFVRTTGGLLQLKPLVVTPRDTTRVFEFASRLGVTLKVAPARTRVPARRAKAAQGVLLDLQAAEPAAFR